MRSIFKTVLLLLPILLVSSAAAQTLTGSINGTVKDEQGALLPGVTVTLSGRQGTQVQLTDAGGQYRFVALEPGTYAVGAELSGFQPARQENLVITAGRNLEIDLSMKVGGVTETLTVVGESPVVDTKSSATETNISQQLLQSAPITRTAINVLNYAPGINSDSAYGGDAGSANALLIDGVDTRDPSGGTAWTFYNYNIVEEFQFQGLGAPAEYGGFTGAVVNTITKSGGNRFSGLFDLYTTGGGLSGNNTPDEAAVANPNLADPAKTKKYADVTTQVGGPLKENKLFFFASAQRFLQELDPSGPVTRNHQVSPRLNLKLTWQASNNDNLTGHVQYDAYNIIGRVPAAYALVATNETTNREDAPEYVWLLQHRHLFGANTFSEIKYTGWWGFYDLNPEVKLPGHFDENGLQTVSQGWFYYADRGRHQVNASLSHYADKFGRHELKFGAEFERSRTRDRYGYNDGVIFYDYGGQPYLAYSYGYDISAKNKRQSVFAQDAWRVGDNWTINAGVRGDFLQGSGETGSNVYSSTNWAPRLGFAWDLAGDHRTVVKGSYGWYYEGAQTALFTRGLPGVEDYVTYEVGPDWSTLTEIDRTPASIYGIADDIKHPRVDELTVAFERALNPVTRFVVTGIWRDSKDFVNSVSPSARWTPIEVQSDLNDRAIGLYRWANPDVSQIDYLIRNVKGFQYVDPDGNVLGTLDPYRKYRAVMFVLSKSLSNRWSGNISYVYSKATGNVDNTGNAQISTRQFETPNLALVNTDGRLTNDRPHEFKVLGSYQVPVIDVAVSGYYRILSGRNYTPFQRFTTSTLNTSGSSNQYRQPLLEPRGSRRLPTQNQLDIRFEKAFQWGDNRFGFYADINNLFNSGTVVNRLTRVPGTSVVTPGGIISLPFETPAALLAPRQMFVGARWAF